MARCQDTAVKITGLFHGNVEEEEAGPLWKEGEGEQGPCRLASAVRRSTAAVDVELSVSLTSHTHTGIVYMECECVSVCLDSEGTLNPVWLRLNRIEALTVTDKRQGPSVKSTWHQASFSLADAKSMTESLAGGQAGGRPSSLFPQLGWKSSDRPPLSESHCS